MTYAKKTAKKESTSEESTMNTATEEVKEVKTFAPTEEVSCRSVTAGELLLEGKKTGNFYSWLGTNDVTGIEYQDLLGLLRSNSVYLFKPLFVIEDKDLLADPKWERLVELYKKIDKDDVSEILSMDSSTFTVAFPRLPAGIQEAVKTEVASLILDKRFDSLQKIKVIDSVCGSELMKMAEG